MVNASNRRILVWAAILSLLGATLPAAIAQTLNEEQLRRLLKKFPAADANRDGILTIHEAQAYRQAKSKGNSPAAAGEKSPPTTAEKPPLSPPPAMHVYQKLGERNLQVAMHYPPDWKPADRRTAILFFSGSHKVQPDANGKLPPLADERARLKMPVINRGPGGDHHVAFCDSFAQRGYVCLHVEYRTRGKDGVLPGEDIDDAAAAMRWARTHFSELGIDPDRVVAAGGSSGAYLAGSLFAFEDRYTATQLPAVSIRPNALLLYSPLVDWLDVGSMSESFLVVLNGDKELGARVSPARHWRNDCPPTLVMVGSDEPQFASVQQFADKWRAAGAPVELEVASDAPHGFFAKPAWFEKATTRTDAFLSAHNLDPIAKATSKTKDASAVTSEIYKTIGSRQLHVAIHHPATWKPTDRRPAMLLFSGGGFNPQDKDTGETIPDAGAGTAKAAGAGGPGQGFLTEAEHFAKLGLVTIRVEYRKRRTDGTLPDKAVEDAKSAVRWARANSARLGIDPGKIITCGGSSGGHLAASCAALADFNAASDDASVSAQPNLMILHYPLLDFLAGGTRKLSFLAALDNDRALGERLSPARHWNKDMPSSLIFIGTKDPMYDTVKEFVAKWNDAGGQVELFIGDNAGHGFSNTPAWHGRVLPRTEAFLRQAGYLPGAE